MSKPNKNLWTFSEAPNPGWISKMVLRGFIVSGLISAFYFFNWWFRPEHVSNTFLYLVLSLVVWWAVFRIIIQWICFLRISKPERKKAPEGLSVAIFTTSSPGEPLEMFDKTLEACARIRYPHTTYLLDDTGDPRFREVAEKHGAVWLELVGYPGAKAGKINEALKRTKEEFILVLDPDHIPFPNFLDEVLGFFSSPEVGFVQVSQAYYNQSQSLTALGAAQQTYSFYGPVQMGLHGFGGAVAIGANCTFRRKALESIGGHGIGLAEDLVTAIRLHAKGWKSVYHPVVVSRGLVPEDLGSFCKQQLKWSRGVHEVLFAELPKAWKTLSFWQRISYFGITTYYVNGLNTLIFLIIPFLFLWFGFLPADMDIVEFIVAWTPLAAMCIIIYLFSQRWYCHPASERGFHWWGMVLKFTCWPVFLLGFILSLVDKKIPYIPTSKTAEKGFSPFMYPILGFQILYVLTTVFIVIQRKYFTHEALLALSSGFIWGMVGFATIAFLVSCFSLVLVRESKNLEVDDPWSIVDIDRIDQLKK